MRPYKRATSIAKSIRKFIQDSGGASLQLALVQVTLPVELFDLMCEDGGVPGATELSVNGVLFKRDDCCSGSPRKGPIHKERRVSRATRAATTLR
jgi:hypothetical protein